MNTELFTETGTILAESVPPEDLCVGDFVTVLNEIVEYPSFLWDCDAHVSPHEPVRVQWRAIDAGLPLRIEAVCLPFVFLEAPEGGNRTLDIRGCQLVRLSAEYADKAWNALRTKRRKKKRKK